MEKHTQSEPNEFNRPTKGAPDPGKGGEQGIGGQEKIETRGAHERDSRSGETQPNQHGEEDRSAYERQEDEVDEVAGSE